MSNGLDDLGSKARMGVVTAGTLRRGERNPGSHPNQSYGGDRYP